MIGQGQFLALIVVVRVGVDGCRSKDTEAGEMIARGVLRKDERFAEREGGLYPAKQAATQMMIQTIDVTVALAPTPTQ